MLKEDEMKNHQKSLKKIIKTSVMNLIMPKMVKKNGFGKKY